MEPTQKLEIELNNNDATTIQEFMDEIPKQGKYWALMFGVLMYQKLQPHAYNGTYPLSRQDCNKLMDSVEELYKQMVEEKKEETNPELKLRDSVPDPNAIMRPWGA